MRALLNTLNSDPWSGRLVFLVSLLLVLLLGYQLAQLGWRVVAPSDPSTSAPDTATATAIQVDPREIAARNLFGRADAGAAPVIVDAPDTQLNLTLRGIAAAGRDEYSRALIAGPDGRERVYAIGATLPGGATVHRVLPDRVLLDRRGTLETLRLPRESVQVPGAPLAPPMGGVVDNLRDINGAEELSEIVRPQPVITDGRLRGYRVYPGRDRQRFAASGLRAGDLVTAVDGVALDNADAGPDALQRLMGSEQVTLTIERGGQVESLTVRLDR
jgi:general secretion pathway protein C